jgi:hypothetical protein
MATRQMSKRGVASATRAEWPRMVSAFLLFLVAAPPSPFCSWLERLSCFHR